ncbi:hypothetical protein MXB_316, partial [Myxobolus squamalis]
MFFDYKKPEPYIIIKNFLLQVKLFYYKPLRIFVDSLDDNVSIDLALHSALLINGAFVIKSELLLQNMVLDAYGTHFDLVHTCACRDVILWLFLQKPAITEDDILKYVS